MTINEKEALRFSIVRLVTAMFKNHLMLIEDLRDSHDDMLDKIESLISEDDKDKLNLINYFDENKYNAIRKRILDLGNDCIRAIEKDLEIYDVKFKQ